MPDSLFGSDREEDGDNPDHTVALLSPPKIEGFWLFGHLIPEVIQDELVDHMSKSIFSSGSNQAMFFSNHDTPEPFLERPIETLKTLLAPCLPPELYYQLFDTTERLNCICNLYMAGQGITPHVDLVDRYGPVVLGISLMSRTVMEFTRDSDTYAVVLKPGDVYVLSGEARYLWKHGIPYRTQDVFLDENLREDVLHRRMRMSVTLRRMKPGAEVVGC